MAEMEERVDLDLDDIREATEIMIQTLNSCERKLQDLALNLRPLYERTQQEAKNQKEIERSIESIRNVLGLYEIPSRVEPVFARGFRVNDKLEFLNAVKDLKRAVDFFKQKPKYHNATKLLQKMKTLANTAAESMMKFYTANLERGSAPIPAEKFYPTPPTSTSTDAQVKRMKGMAGELLDVAQHLALLDVTRHRAAYVEHRAGFLTNTLSELDTHIRAHEKNALDGWYTVGKHPFVHFITCFRSLCEFESELAGLVYPLGASGGDYDLVLEQIYAKPTVAFAECVTKAVGRSAAHQPDGMPAMPLWIADLRDRVAELLDAPFMQYDVNVGAVQGLCAELEAVGKRALADYGTAVWDAAARIAIPDDSTVLSLTSSILEHSRRALEWRVTLEEMLAADNMSFSAYVQGVIDGFFKSLEARARKARSAAHGLLLVLNNQHHVLHALAAPPLVGLVPRAYVKGWEDAVRTLIDAYKTETWSKTLSYLLIDPDKADGKSKLKMFNKEFESTYYAQKKLCVPSVELRNQLRQEVVDLLVPGYAEFVMSLVRPANAPPSSGASPGGVKADAVKYAPETLESMLQQLYDV